MSDLSRLRRETVCRPDSDSGVRSVVRVLRLLRVMNQRALWSLHELHLETGLPKTTLSRLLATLQQEGYARPELPAGTWRLAAKVRELDGGYTEGHRLIDAGRSLLLATTRQIKWPLAIGLLEVDAIAVRFSSMPYSPLAVHTTTLGHRLGLVESAMGRAHLAFCAPATRTALLDHLQACAPARPAWPRGWIEHDLQRVHEAGHAVRQPDAQRGTATLAVPVCMTGEAVAVLAMTTFGTAMTTATIDRHLPVLQDTAARLALAAAAEQYTPDAGS